MIEKATSILARLADLLLSQAPEPIAIPIRRDDRRGPGRGR